MAPCSLKLPSLLKTFCLASSKKEEEDVGHTSNSELKTHQVIIIGIQHRVIMKMKNWRKASLKLPESNKSDNVAYNEMDLENAIDSESEEFFSVRSCFTQCCGEAGEHFFDECEGWPFGLWQQRSKLLLPPLPKSPSDSWNWHKGNLRHVKVWPVWAKKVI